MITTLDQVTEQRLCWPDTKPRAAQRIASSFISCETAREERRIEHEFGRWGVRKFIVSRNNLRIFAGDPAAAAWWLHPRAGDLRVLACDKYQKLADNLHAIALTLEAMRALERWGAYTAEQAAQGARLALPLPAPAPAARWKEIFGFVPGLGADRQLVLVEHAYRSQSREAAGDEDRQRILNLAIEAARKELTHG
jgi:hypothetical protein